MYYFGFILVPQQNNLGKHIVRGSLFHKHHFLAFNEISIYRYVSRVFSLSLGRLIFVYSQQAAKVADDVLQAVGGVRQKVEKLRSTKQEKIQVYFIIASDVGLYVGGPNSDIMMEKSKGQLQKQQVINNIIMAFQHKVLIQNQTWNFYEYLLQTCLAV